MDAVKILGNLLGGGSMSSGLGGQLVGGLLKNAMGGGRSSGGGGVGDLLGAALGGGGGGGGVGDLLGAALGGGSGRSSGRSSGGGLGGVLGTVAMAALAKYTAGGGGMPDLGSLFGGSDAPQAKSLAALDDSALNDQAELLIEAMINAAKADGRVDPTEERAILERMGELDAEEAEFVRAKVQAPLDVAAFAARVPTDMREQVYGTSLLAMELDERSEAVYLRDLARGLALDPETCNAIHQEMGAPALYR